MKNKEEFFKIMQRIGLNSLICFYIILTRDSLINILTMAFREEEYLFFFLTTIVIFGIFISLFYKIYLAYKIYKNYK